MRWLVVFSMLLCCTVTATAQETRIAAVVNSDIVSDDDVAARLTLVMKSSGIPDTPQNRQRLTPRVLRSLIDERLEMQEAKHLDVTVSKKEIDRALDRLEARNHMPKGSLDKYLTQNGVSRATLVDQITAALAWDQVVRKRVALDVSVSDEEITEAMNRLKEDVGKPQSRVAEIFLAVDNPSQDGEVQRLATRLIAQIRGGANFSAVAQQFSQSPSAAVGGDIGWVTPGELSPLLGEAVRKMNPGEMSYPIHTPAGYYILYLIDRQTLGATSPNQIRLALIDVVFALPPTLTPAQRAHVEAEAQQVSAGAKSCGEMAKIAHDYAPQLSRQIPDITAGNLPPDQRQQILALKVAEPSKPMPFPGGVGVIMVCKRQDPPGIPTREQIEDNLLRERIDALARRYMIDLRRGAYVDIRG